MSAAREKICINCVFARNDGLIYKASTKDTLNIPVAYYTCGSQAFFSDKKILRKVSQNLRS